MPTKVLQKRYTTIDCIRGLAVLAMIAYHLIWDLVYVHDVPVGNFGDRPVIRVLIQRGIRWTFIFLSGFCFQLGRRKLRRSLMVLGGGVIITLVTMVVMPDYPIHHGVLTFIGSAMLLSIPVDKAFSKVSGWIGLPVCLLLFLTTEFLSDGYFGREGIYVFWLPTRWYANYFTAWLGLPNFQFYSADYVGLIPWIFSFWMGYFTYTIFKKHNWMKALSLVRFKPLEWVGRNALLIYMLHQPLVYGVLYVIFLILD